MAVESVNGSNINTGLYTSAGALAGAGIGAAAGWCSKPYLKDGVPTDSFTKKLNENLTELLSPEEKEFFEAVEKNAKSILKKFDEAKSIEGIKNLFINQNMGDASLDVIKERVAVNKLSSDIMGVNYSSAFQEMVEKVSKANSLDEVKTVFAETFDKEYKGKSLDEIKAAIKAEVNNTEKTNAKVLFEQFWDSSKKQFVNCEEGVGKAIKKAAKSVQGKAALIYGAVGAAVLGAVTYLCCGNKKS